MKNIVVLIYLALLIPLVGAQEINKFDRPQRSYSVILTEDGFRPENLIAYEGEKLNINITATQGDKGCFFLREHNVFLAAQRGKINQGSVNLDQQGSFEFYCPSLKFKGTLTVLEKPEQKSQVRREIASEKTGVNYWLPRDYD